MVLRVAREEQAGTGAEAETRGGSKKRAGAWKVLGLVGGDRAPFAGHVNSIATRPSTQSFVLLGLQMACRREEQAGTGRRGGDKGRLRNGGGECKVLGLVGGDLALFAGNLNFIAMRPSGACFTLPGSSFLVVISGCGCF